MRQRFCVWLITSAANTYGLLTITRSYRELVMVDANLELRPPVTECFVTIQRSQRSQRNWRSRTTLPLYPWMKLAGRWIEQASFEPGQRVRINVEHGRLTITCE